MVTQDKQDILDRALAALPDRPDDHATLLVVVEETFKALTDAEYQQGVSTTVPGATDVYGVRVPDLRAFARVLTTRFKGDSYRDALRALSLATWDVGSREHQLLALFMLERARLTPIECWQLSHLLLPDVDNWESCDQLCIILLGPALVADTGYMDALEGWLEDPNFWQRRAALVTTTRLRLFKGPADEAEALDRRALAMCEALLDDPEPYIAKAVDFAVREVIRRHPEMGAAWMLAQAKTGLSRKARSTLKKSAKKLAPDEKAQFLALLEDGA
jgi:3-methyladenine DNA glycosylase AlkD